MVRNKGNRPLMIYTSLIFVVAIMMVVVAFFGTRHLESKQIQQKENVSSISEKASFLSEENMLLMEANLKLKEENDALTEENKTLAEANQTLSNENEMAKKLQDAYIALNRKGKSSAKKLLKGIFSEDLTADQKDFYDLLMKKCE